METILGGCRYENIIYNAHWNNISLDTKFHPDASDVSTAINHLEDCKNFPTVALLARKKYRTNNYPDYFQRNLYELYNSSKWVRNADREYRENFHSMYPKTGNIRKFLINSESIVLDYVKPVKKTFKRAFMKMINKF